MRKLSLIVCLFVSFLSYAQLELTKCTNNSAKDLVHELTNDKKGLYLSNKEGINSIKILNENYPTKLIDCHNQKLFYYPTKDFKGGLNTIMVLTNSKIIVFTINKTIEPTLIEEKEPEVKEEVNVEVEVLKSIKQPYNLTNKKRGNTQTREEYRKINLRPNGKKYD